MSYGRIQRESVRRPAGPYDRPRTNARPTSSFEAESSSTPFWSRIISSVKGLLSFSQHDDKDTAEKPIEMVESSELDNDSILESRRPSSPKYEWLGVPINDMAYGELRRICSEAGLRVSEDRDVMLNDLREHIISQQNRRRPEGQNKRRLSNDDASLEQIMLKKAKVGFSQDEFEKYMVLMKENLKSVDDDIGRFSPRALSPLESSREVRRQSLRKRVPTPFAHLSSSRRPSRRDSLSGPGAVGPIHLSFPSTVTTTEDIHDLSNSSKTARSILSSISSMSIPLIQSNEVLAKKRLQPRKPFNPYAQVGPPPNKPAFRIQPPIPKSSSDEPVKVSHKFGDDGMLKRPREDSVMTPSLSPSTFKIQPPTSSKPTSEISKPASAPAPSKESFAPFKSAQFSFSPPTSVPPSAAVAAAPPSVPKTTAAPAPVMPATSAAPEAPAEEALCPVCEMGMDDVDHSECKAGESSPGHKPSAAPVSGLFSGKALEPSGSAGFSFQLPKFPETAQKDVLPSFSFEPPKPTETPTFSFSAPTSQDTGVISQPGAPASPLKFSFGLPPKKDESKSEEKEGESRPALDGLFKPPATGFSFESADVVKAPTLEPQAKKAATEAPSAPATSSATFSFGFPASTSVAVKPDATELKPAEFTFSSKATPFKLGATSDQAKTSQPTASAAPSTSQFSFGAPAITSAAPTPVIDLTKDSTPTLAAAPAEFKFDLKPKEPDLGSATAGAGSSTSPLFSTSSFQFGPAATGCATSATTTSTTVQFGAAATAPSTTTSSTPLAFQFGSTTPAPATPAVPPSTSGFGFGASSSMTPAPSSSTGLLFGTSEPSSTANPPSTPFKFGMADTKPAPIPSFGFGGSSMQSTQPANAIEESSAMATNNAPSTLAPTFSFGSNLSTPIGGFGQSAAPAGSVFSQATPSLPSSGFGFGSDAIKPGTSMDMLQSGTGFPFGQTAPPSTPSAPFSFGSAAPSTASFPGAINFDAPVPENLGGSFSHGMAPQGRTMVKAKRVARKR